jgi:hypothetical protein
MRLIDSRIRTEDNLPDSVSAPIGIPRDANGNPHPLFLIGAGVVVLVGVYALAKKGGSGGSTVAGGISIPAALSSLEQEAQATQEAIGKSNQAGAWRSIASLWAANQVSYAGSESAEIATLRAINPNDPQLPQLQKDMQNRLDQALGIYKQMGGVWPASGPMLDPNADLSASHLATAGTGTF